MRHRAVAIAFAVITLAMTASPAAAAQLPVVYNGILGYAHASPTASPPGANGLFTLASYFPGGSSLVGADCPACQEQEAGSSFITNLNAGGETAPGVNYTVIESDNDEVVTPYTSAFVAPASNVTNILLQSQCSLDQGEHRRCRTTTSRTPTCSPRSTPRTRSIRRALRCYQFPAVERRARFPAVERRARVSGG